MSDDRPSILVVDDDQVFRERMARALADRGYDVRAAGDYDTAMSSAVSDSPELAVIDLRMPGRTGLELAQDLLKLDASTKIVLLTGYASVATAVEAMRLGAVHYLAKPADADEIIAAFSRGDAPSRQPVGFEPASLARAEWEHIHRVLADCSGNISEAARLLGIHRRSLQRKLKKHPPSK